MPGTDLVTPLNAANLIAKQPASTARYDYMFGSLAFDNGAAFLMNTYLKVPFDFAEENVNASEAAFNFKRLSIMLPYITGAPPVGTVAAYFVVESAGGYNVASLIADDAPLDSLYTAVPGAGSYTSSVRTEMNKRMISLKIATNNPADPQVLVAGMIRVEAF